VRDCASISFIANDRARAPVAERSDTSDFAPDVAKAVRHFHRTIPGYSPTPLHALNDLAAEVGVARVWVKDESPRFGLDAFKVLGASYALSCELTRALGLDGGDCGAADFSTLLEHRDRIEEMEVTVVTATDGNHGRGLAWVARELGCECVVFMPHGTVPARFDAIAALGADVTIIEGGYDDAVSLARGHAMGHGSLLVQDTAWKGYERIPRRIMKGYLTVLDEALEQLHGEMPTHVLVQCGVGSLAAALAAHLHQHLGERRPVFASIEPVEAACCYQSAAAHTGEPHRVEGECDTIMAGLACGTPSTLAWPILHDYADVFICCEDEVARRGMRLLARPHGNDPAVVSGESGAVTTGLLACLLGECMRKEHYEAVTALGLNAASRVLLISTEGATDPQSHAAVVSGQPSS
jgi:diaminopropionate ammonia-lyase